MKIGFQKFSLNAEIIREANSSKFLFLLHGFSGSGNDWKEITPKLNRDFNIVAVDLIGHGKSDSPDDASFYTCPAIVSQLYAVTKNFTEEKIFLTGYSMGGRAALSFAVHFPHLLKGLILESSTAGIKNDEEKTKRIAKDRSTAEFILNHSLEEFADYWMNLDIFNTQRRFSNAKLNEIKKAKVQNDKVGLANSLIGFGTGSMPSFWNNLPGINSPVLLITGELDSKFSGINSEMAELLPSAKHKIIKSAGHNTHLEEPKEFIETVNEFLN